MMIDVVNLNIVLPSVKAPESKALYDKVREMAAATESVSDQDLVDTLLSGLFNIVAKLESQSQER
ncbi:MAG: hypothetical protein QOC69_3046 [Mycobacterium sp.]|jgi:hypothetical protein|nr:hypothetical protein [Mycobacterium sp.]